MLVVPAARSHQCEGPSCRACAQRATRRSVGLSHSSNRPPGKREDKMKSLLMSFLGLVIAGSPAALADTPVSPAETEKIQAALQAWGCSGGKMEKETEATGVYEVDDAKCRDGQYDVKLDKDFRVIVITRD